jgi:hypothetical protein
VVPSTAFLRFMRSVSTLMLLLALAGGLMLMLGSDSGERGVDVVDFDAGYRPGTVIVEPFDAIGPDPFTAPVAVDLGIDPDLLVLPPTSAEDLDSPHGRASLADRLVATGLAWRLAEVGDPTAAPTLEQIRRAVDLVADGTAVIEGLEDRNGDGFDDDSRFTLVARDGSAVCVRSGPRRSLALAQGLAVDPEDGASVSGIAWDPSGPCLRTTASGGSPVAIGSAAGVFGAASGGEVCDLGRLAELLAANPPVGRGWAEVHDIHIGDLGTFLGTLTPVVLLDDTRVTNHGWRSGTIVPRQAILQRGTTVMVDPRGVPAVRCLSGSPLRPPQGLPTRPNFEGPSWDGFLGVEASAVDPVGRPSVVLLDIRSGAPITRESGVDGALAGLAGPVVGFEG